MTESVSFQLRRGNSSGATGWTAVNPILAPGEPGFEIDTDTLKIGDGATRWNDLEMLRFGSSVAIGQSAGYNQQANSVSVGYGSGSFQRDNSVAIGNQAGNFQKENSVAIGFDSGYNQGKDSISIGNHAGSELRGLSYTPPFNLPIIVKQTQAENTIILNATGVGVAGISGQTGSCYIAPIRNTTGVSGIIPLSYNTETKEVTASGSGIVTASILPSQDGVFNLGSPTQRFKTVYATTASISTQTLVMSEPGSTGPPSASFGFYNGGFLFADHSSGKLMSVGPSGFQTLSYNTYYGPTGILGLPPGTEEISPYNILGLTYIFGGNPTSKASFILTGGSVGTAYTYSLNANVLGVTYF
jgi:hypothetical protein